MRHSSPDPDDKANVVARWLLWSACGALLGGLTCFLCVFHYGISMCDSWDLNGADIISRSIKDGVIGIVVGAVGAIIMHSALLARQKRAHATLSAAEASLATARTTRNVRRTLIVSVIVLASAYFLEWKKDFYYPPSPLVLAAKYENRRAVAWLIRHRVDVNELDGSGATALINASANGDWQTVKLLLDHGARVNETGRYFYTALHGAASQDDAYKEKKCIDLLIAHGADVNARTFEGEQTPLMFASETGSIKAIQTLVQSGAQVNDQDAIGEDSLMYASGSGRFDAVKYLLSKGADVTASDSSRMNALMCALANHRNDCAKLLISNGARVNVKDEHGDTPISLAKANPGMLAILKAAGAK